MKIHFDSGLPKPPVADVRFRNSVGRKNLMTAHLTIPNERG